MSCPEHSRRVPVKSLLTYIPVQSDMSSLDNNLPVLEELRNLERELHKAETRRNRKRMETLIHPSFIEFGRSGTRYSRADVLEEYDPNSTLPAIRSENFQMANLADGIVLLTYVSAHLDADGNAHRHTDALRRTSTRQFLQPG